MPQRHGWLTPDSLPSGTRCIELNVPDDDDFWSMLKGALVPLFDSEQFEEYGALTPEECSQYWVDWDAANDWGECGMTPIIGEIRMFAADSNIPAGWLACSGTELQRALYPELFAVIGITYGSFSEDYFNLPDLRDKFPLGAGSGHNPGDTGGEDVHFLTESEMPAHHHTVPRINTGSAAITTFQRITTALTVTEIPTSDVGGGEAHNNVPPFQAVWFYIYAGA